MRGWHYRQSHPLIRERRFNAPRGGDESITAAIETLPTRNLEGVRHYRVMVGARAERITGLDFAKIAAYRLVGSYFRIKAANYNGSTCTNPWIRFCDCAKCRRQS